MNCKPGDLAVIVKSESHLRRNIGHVCRILEAVEHPVWRNNPGWAFEPPTVMGHDCALDECLRPLRNPGDDAQDETLSWLPVPTTEGVPA